MKQKRNFWMNTCRIIKNSVHDPFICSEVQTHVLVYGKMLENTLRLLCFANKNGHECTNTGSRQIKNNESYWQKLLNGLKGFYLHNSNSTFTVYPVRQIGLVITRPKKIFQ